MKKKLNKAWHAAHVMPRNATLTQRVKWHAAHRKHCACRPVPDGLLKQMKKNGLNF